uniref:Uncharacterized protein n=1 Tax=Rhipicephalus appendiculatus TaxID=34631 RepID=A0A131YZJ6_RHIAP
MKYQVVAIFAILCFASTKVNADGDVDTLIKKLEMFVESLNLDEEKSQEILDKLDKAREKCLSDADDINPEVIQKLVEGAMPVLTQCAESVADVENPEEKGTKMIGCIAQKAKDFAYDSEMTDEEKQKFDAALECLKNLVEE